MTASTISSFTSSMLTSLRLSATFASVAVEVVEEEMASEPSIPSMTSPSGDGGGVCSYLSRLSIFICGGGIEIDPFLCAGDGVYGTGEEMLLCEDFWRLCGVLECDDCAED